MSPWNATHVAHKTKAVITSCMENEQANFYFLLGSECPVRPKTPSLAIGNYKIPSSATLQILNFAPVLKLDC